MAPVIRLLWFDLGRSPSLTFSQSSAGAPSGRPGPRMASANSSQRELLLALISAEPKPRGPLSLAGRQISLGFRVPRAIAAFCPYHWQFHCFRCIANSFSEKLREAMKHASARLLACSGGGENRGGGKEARFDHTYAAMFRYDVCSRQSYGYGTTGFHGSYR